VDKDDVRKVAHGLIVEQAPASRIARVRDL
jgi:hypothetical protein